MSATQQRYRRSRLPVSADRSRRSAAEPVVAHRHTRRRPIFVDELEVRMARELDDLPYARYLTDLDGDLEAEGDYDCVRVDGRELDDLDVRHARFSESVFTMVAFTRGSLRYSRFADVWLRHVRWVGTELADTGWLDGEVVSGAMSGVDFAGANLRRVRFEGCKFDSVNFRGAQLREVSFVDCVLRDCDFADAALTDITVPGSELVRLSLRQARLAKVDLRGATALDFTEGLDSLRGATITTLQLLDLAPAFARSVGITVQD
ncbi:MULTISPECIES: pentapeptide repeat-containing protein [Nocardia]|uniref:pentapeptide repeat-containing protein n=1 Tax=Nocardia TaxID=1817 RepID=UPI001E5B7405|nr:MULTISPECIES: pentapeptide repeat-containing protein [Nocardia]MDE1674054.1 pentapeptide repeat-containing protein [Nocardia gipuzkoensis]